MEYLLQLAASPTAWIALATLIVMEIVLGIDNLIFISILTNNTIAFIVQLTEPVIDILGQSFSWKDMILIAGGLFLVWKATTEIHHSMDPEKEHVDTGAPSVTLGFASHLPIMIIAVVVSVIVMLVAAEPLAKFINDNPTIVMLALGFLIMIGMTLIAEGFGAHVPKGYVYAAMAFSAAIECLNMMR
eukprot:gene18586-22145_t